jgi:hypothetical protein
MAKKIDTGKVIIGSCYEPALTPESDPDMLRLQRALLPPAHPLETRAAAAADMVLYVVAAIGLVVIIFV